MSALPNSPSLQTSMFPDGGFVAHKITGNWTGNISAWFDKNNGLLDAEFSGGRPIKKGGPIWKELQWMAGNLAFRARKGTVRGNPRHVGNGIWDYSEGDRVLITPNTFRHIYNSNRSTAFPSDTFVEACRTLMESKTAGTVTKRFHPGYEFNVKFDSGDVMQMKDHWVDSIERSKLDKSPQIDGMGFRHNPRTRKPVDDTAATELYLYAIDRRDFYRIVENAMMPNVVCKLKAGTYKHELAGRLYEPLAEKAAKAYSVEFSDGKDGLTMFNKATREEVGRRLADHYLEEAKKLAGTRTNPKPDSRPVYLLRVRKGAKVLGWFVGGNKVTDKVKEAKTYGKGNHSGDMKALTGAGYVAELVVQRSALKGWVKGNPKPFEGIKTYPIPIEHRDLRLKDPTKDEMTEHLRKVFGRELDDFDLEGAIYWFANFNHGGQWSNLYSVLSTSSFRPGPISRGPEPGSMEEMAYQELEAKFGA